MWYLIFMILCTFMICLIAGALVAYSIWYMLLLFLKPLKIEKLFEIELPLPVAISLLGIGIWYGCHIKDYIEIYESKHQKTELSKQGIKKKASVYICTGETSTKYHCDQNCHGLSNCSGEIDEVSKDEAEEMGRTPCKICY